MAAENFIFKNFSNISETECFINLKDDELHELIEAAIKSEYCSTNDILTSLHRWVVNAQSDARINTFLTLVKKLPRDVFDEKVFADIFLDDPRLRNNSMCRNFRDDYLCDFFKKHIERNNSSGGDPRRSPERGMKRKVETAEVDKARKRVVAGGLEELPVATEATFEPAIKSNVTATTRILENSPFTASTSAQQPPVPSTSVQQIKRLNQPEEINTFVSATSNVTKSETTRILGNSPSPFPASASAQQSSLSPTTIQRVKRVFVGDELQLVPRQTTFGPGIKSNVTAVAQIFEKSPSIASTSAQQPSTSVQKAVVVDTERKKQFSGSVGKGKSTKIISGGDGSDCIGYFTSKENDSWIIGSFNLANGDVERITDIPNYREDGGLIHAYNYLYYIGGRLLRDASSESEYSDGQEAKGQVSRRIDIFDMTERNWITENLPQLNEAREDFQRCVADRCIYIIGGIRTDGSDIDSAEYVPLYGITKPKQHHLPQQEEHSDDDFDEYGGCTLYCLQGDIYHTASGEWGHIPKIPVARTGHSTAVYKSKMYVFGGVRTAFHYKLASACVYDMKTNVWTMLPNMHRKRYHACSVIHNNYIYIVGGDGDGGQCKTGGLTIERFNPATKEFQIIHNWLDKVPSDVNFYLMAERIE